MSDTGASVERTLVLLKPDAVSAELVRRPGRRGAASTVLYRGDGSAFADKSVQDGRSYRYVLSVTDTAGNVTTRTVTAAWLQTSKSTVAEGGLDVGRVESINSARLGEQRMFNRSPVMMLTRRISAVCVCCSVQGKCV